jgi:hypothetical protein
LFTGRVVCLQAVLFVYRLCCLFTGRVVYFTGCVVYFTGSVVCLQAVLFILQAVLFVWEQIQDSDHRMYHAHRSFAGVALVVLRILLAAMFAWNLNVIVSSERSALRREFYKSFTKV